MSSKSKIWYSYNGGKSQDDHISFYENDQFDWVETLQSKFPEIQSEIENYLLLNEEKIKPYFNESLVTHKTKWKTSAFQFWNWKVKKNAQQCPKTIAAFSEIPGLVSLSMSILESGLTIKPHRGDTNAIIRGHFPISIPGGLPDCGMMVNELEREWKEGVPLLFNDAAKHSAWNLTSQRRYVLIFDVIRPEYENRKYLVSANVLTGLLFQAVFQSVGFLKKVPKLLIAPFFLLTIGLVWSILQVRRITRL